MAKPKERSVLPIHSNVFQDRCSKEKEKLQKRLSQQLEEDIGRLFDEGQQCDVTFDLECGRVSAHRIILKARSEEFSANLIEQADSFRKTSINSKKLADFIRRLYTTEHVTTLIVEIEEYLQKHASQWNEYSKKISADRLHVSEDDQNPGCLTDSLAEIEVSAQNETEISSDLLPGPAHVPLLMTEVQSEEYENDTLVNGIQLNGDINKPDKSKSDSGVETMSTAVEKSLQQDELDPHEACSQLGQELLQVYSAQIDPDCVVTVNGGSFKVHRCILAARSLYFAAMMSGSWAESETMTFKLENVGASTMVQVLLYLYGGVIDTTTTCNFSELVMMADMLGLDGLKEVVSYAIKKELCHFFHKPCTSCISGSVEALGAAVTFNLQEVKERCLCWINKNFTRVWSTKGFAILPPETLDICYSQIVETFTVATVLDTMLDCKKLDQSMPRLKWTCPVLALVDRLMAAAVNFTCDHFVELLSSPIFLNFDQHMALSMDLLEDIFGSVIKSLPTDKACEAFMSMHSLRETVNCEKSDIEWSEEFNEFVDVLCVHFKNYMNLHIHRLVHSENWDLVPPDLQRELLQSASYVCVDNRHRGKVVPPKLTSMGKKPSDSLPSKRRDIRKVKPNTTPAESCSSARKNHSVTMATSKLDRLGRVPQRRTVKGTDEHTGESLGGAEALRKSTIPDHTTHKLAVESLNHAEDHDDKQSRPSLLQKKVSIEENIERNHEMVSREASVKIMPIFVVNFISP
ncbi:hypothetical protein ScPMuIL_011202 [Solemya velum]